MAEARDLQKFSKGELSGGFVGDFNLPCSVFDDCFG